MSECIRKDYPPAANSCEGVNYSKPFKEWDCQYCAKKVFNRYRKWAEEMRAQNEALKSAMPFIVHAWPVSGIRPKKWWQFWK